MRPKTITQSFAAADADLIASAQTLAGAGDLALNAAAADIGDQRHVVITSAADDTGVIFTVYGTNDHGQEIQESIAGTNGGVAESVLNFNAVTRVAADGATAGDVEVGTNAEGESRPYLLDNRQRTNPFDCSLAVESDGTANVTVQYTFHLIHGDVDFKNRTDVTWYNHTGLSALTAATAGSIESPVTAVRLRRNSGAGDASLTVIQQGPP